MKNLIYTLALISLTWFSSSCADDDAPLPEDYTNVGVPTDNINSTLIGQWKKYVITRTTYTNSKETTQTLGTYTGDFRIDGPGTTWNDFIVYNFPYSGTFEVRRYGERLAFYDRANNRHTNLMLHELSLTKAVFREHQKVHDDYFIVTSHTLTK